MAAASFLKACYFSHFSKPACDRILYRIIRKRKVRRILELGVGDGRRAMRMIEMAERGSSGGRATYVGIDLFESRTPADGPGLTLKEAHCLLGATEGRIRLIPGDPGTALARTANELKKIDLVVISESADETSMQRAWFYLPRVMHPDTCVIRREVEPEVGTTLRVLPPAEIARLSDVKMYRRAA